MFFPTVSKTKLTIFFPCIVERKAWFDKFGEFGLKEGVPAPNGGKVFKIIM
jgi:hypothetical protein